jgi:hypothetical protein
MKSYLLKSGCPASEVRRDVERRDGEAVDDGGTRLNPSGRQTSPRMAAANRGGNEARRAAPIKPKLVEICPLRPDPWHAFMHGRRNRLTMRDVTPELIDLYRIVIA